MIHYKYSAPTCESDSQWEPSGLLANSDLTDSGAGEFLDGGNEFTF